MAEKERKGRDSFQRSFFVLSQPPSSVAAASGWVAQSLDHCDVRFSARGETIAWLHGRQHGRRSPRDLYQNHLPYRSLQHRGNHMKRRQ